MIVLEGKITQKHDTRSNTNRRAFSLILLPKILAYIVRKVATKKVFVMSVINYPQNRILLWRLSNVNDIVRLFLILMQVQWLHYRRGHTVHSLNENIIRKSIVGVVANSTYIAPLLSSWVSRNVTHIQLRCKSYKRRGKLKKDNKESIKYFYKICSLFPLFSTLCMSRYRLWFRLNA